MPPGFAVLPLSVADVQCLHVIQIWCSRVLNVCVKCNALMRQFVLILCDQFAENFIKFGGGTVKVKAFRNLNYFFS